MSVSSARMRVKGELKDLLIAWQRAQDSWRDPVSRAFEKNRIAPLDKQIRATMTAMEKIEKSLDQAKRECGDD
jgi:hypothetical protein